MTAEYFYNYCINVETVLQSTSQSKQKKTVQGTATWAAEQGGTGGTCTPHLFWKGGTRGYTL